MVSYEDLVACAKKAYDPSISEEEFYTIIGDEIMYEFYPAVFLIFDLIRRSTSEIKLPKKKEVEYKKLLRHMTSGYSVQTWRNIPIQKLWTWVNPKEKGFPKLFVSKIKIYRKKRVSTIILKVQTSEENFYTGELDMSNRKANQVLKRLLQKNVYIT